MKNLLLVSLASIGVLALVGCADANRSTVTTTRSATLSSDSKDMVRTTTVPDVETQAPPPPEPKAPVDNTVNYPAIHSSGQGSGYGGG